MRPTPTVQRLIPVVLIGLTALLTQPVRAQSIPLTFRPISAEYSAPLDRIIMISALPNQVHIYDPVSLVDLTVNLPTAPLSLSISPDGLHAAIGHDAAVSYVNLSTASLDRVYAVSITPSNIALGSAWVYIWNGGYYAASVNLSTGAVSNPTNYYFAVSGGRLNDSVHAIYGTRDLYSPNDVERLDVSTGPITTQTDSVYHDDYKVCGGAFFSADAGRIYTGCATVFRASTDASLDMRYVTTLTGVSTVGSLADSAALKRVAVLQKVNGNYYSTPPNDRAVYLYESDYLNPVGQFPLTDFQVGPNNYAAHGRFVFFNNASTALVVVKQADSSSGLLNDYAVQIIAVDPPGLCGASFASSSATAIAAGVQGSVNVVADRSCRYAAQSNDSWIQIQSGGYGSGNGALRYMVRANAGSTSRTGSISLGSSTFTITQSGASTASSFARVPDTIVEAGYSRQLERLIFISSVPNEVHIFDPSTGAEQRASLVMPPLSLSVSPDGLSAAIGHDGWVSYVNLQTASVSKVIQVTTDVAHIALAGNGYAYLFPARSTSDIYALNLATNTLTATNATYDGRVPRLYADGNALYVGGTDFSKWNISNGPAVLSVSWPNGIATCGNLWLTRDGSRLFTACGKGYSTSPVASLDLQYAGQLSDISGITWADQSPVNQTTAVIPVLSTSSYTPPSTDTEVRLYGDAFLGFSGRLALPGFSTYAGHGQFVFWNGAENKLYVIEKADATANLTSPYGIATIATSGAGDNCTFSVGKAYASATAAGGYDAVNLSTGSTCVWTASSNASWLTVSTGLFGFGSTTVSFSTAPNPSQTARSATLTIAGQAITITQAGTAVATVSVSPASGNGWSQNFTATYSAGAGTSALAFTQLLVATNPTGGGQSFCFVHYDARGNGLWLYGDGGFFLGPVAPGSASNLLQNTLCAVNTSTSSVQSSGSLLTLNINVVFKASATRNVYLRAQTLTGVDTGWVQQGSWTAAAAAVGSMSVSPSSGSGSTQTFVLTYPDAAGFPGANFGWVQFLVAAASNGGGQPFCFVHYDRGGNGLWMYSSDVGYFLGPVAPGAASNALSSSACSVNTAGVTVTNNSGNLVVSVPITMKAPMAGPKLLFERTLDLLMRDTGWQQTGSWTVQ